MAAILPRLQWRLGSPALRLLTQRRRSKKISKPRVTGFCEGNSPVTEVLPKICHIFKKASILSGLPRMPESMFRNLAILCWIHALRSTDTAETVDMVGVLNIPNTLQQRIFFKISSLVDLAYFHESYKILLFFTNQVHTCIYIYIHLSTFYIRKFFFYKPEIFHIPFQNSIRQWRPFKT